MIELIDLKVHGDFRGSLVSIEAMKSVPFDIKRVYYIFGNTEDVKRGCHAHRELKQFAICVSGSCKMMLDNGREKRTFELNHPSKGLLITSLVWREMFDFTPDCVLLVLANTQYDENDYIRTYELFLKEIEK